MSLIKAIAQAASKLGEVLGVMREAKSILNGFTHSRKAELEERLVTAAEQQAEAQRIIAEAASSIASSSRQVASLFLLLAARIRQNSGQLTSILNQAQERGLDADFIDEIRRRFHNGDNHAA